MDRSRRIDTPGRSQSDLLGGPLSEQCDGRDGGVNRLAGSVLDRSGNAPAKTSPTMNHVPSTEDERLLRRGLLLEYITLVWNVVGTAIVIAAAVPARS